MTVAELCDQLQSLANEGYGIHAIELLTECDSCTSDIVVDNPKLEILHSDRDTVKLLFRNGVSRDYELPNGRPENTRN